MLDTMVDKTETGALPVEPLLSTRLRHARFFATFLICYFFLLSLVRPLGLTRRLTA